MLDRLTACAHGVWFRRAHLHRFDDVLMLPPPDPALHYSCTGLQRASPARVGPVAAQARPIFLVRIVVREPLASRTNGTSPFAVAKVFFRPPLRLAPDIFRLGGSPWCRPVRGQNLLAVEVPAVGDGFQAFSCSAALASLAMLPAPTCRCRRWSPRGDDQWFSVSTAACTLSPTTPSRATSPIDRESGSVKDIC